MSSENELKAELEILLARNMELELLIQQQHSDIDKTNELNAYWFDVLKEIKKMIDEKIEDRIFINSVKSLVGDL